MLPRLIEVHNELINRRLASRSRRSASGGVQALSSRLRPRKPPNKKKKQKRKQAEQRLRFQIGAAVSNRWRCFHAPPLPGPTPPHPRTFTSASRLQSQSAFLCSLIIDSSRRQALPSLRFVFTTLPHPPTPSQTRRATPLRPKRHRKDQPIHRARASGTSRTGRLVRTGMHKMHKPRNVFVLLQK